MFDSLNSFAFPGSADFYTAEFESILAGITSCYKMMIEDNVSVPSNDENGIRDILLLNYLKNREIRRKVKLTTYRFDREIPEDTTKGRVDIRIISKNDFEIDEAYYVIECKRLDNKNLLGTTGFNAEYVNNGIRRFIEGKYSTYYGVNGMIGFVVKQLDISANIININNLLRGNFFDANTETVLTFHNFVKDFKYQYYSIHKDIKDRRIKLYHLMFDFSANIEKP